MAVVTETQQEALVEVVCRTCPNLVLMCRWQHLSMGTRRRAGTALTWRTRCSTSCSGNLSPSLTSTGVVLSPSARPCTFPGFAGPDTEDGHCPSSGCLMDHAGPLLACPHETDRHSF